MWKYAGKKQCNDYLLSLNLFNYKSNDDYLKTLYIQSNNPQYKIYKIKKASGKYRTIYEPSPLLKCIQKRILTNILEKREISSYAKAYHKGINLKDNAIPHIKQKVVLKLDIKNFFDSINFLSVYNSAFPLSIFPRNIALLFTHLCTYKGHLPQGAPTSSYIANLFMKDFDETVGDFCLKQNINYTRYSDDMTFSGDFLPSDIILFIRKKLKIYNLTLNKDKIRVLYNYNSQNVTGIIVNEKAQVNKKYRKELRQEIYYIQKYGIKEHLKKINIDDDEGHYLKTIYGKVLYVLQINNNDQEFQKYKKIIKNLMS